MKLFQTDTEDHTPKADEDHETREIRVTVFPEGGGAPWIKDVTVQPDGTFQLDEEDGQTYKVAQGSIWREGSTDRAFLLEHSPATVNPHQLDGDPVITAEDLHSIARNNLWMQLDEVSQRSNPWGNAQKWGMVVGFVALCILLFWQIKTMGDGFEQLANALEGARMAADNTGHNPISPGGN